MEGYADKKVIVFDLDGTLTESKGVLDDEISELIRDLLMQRAVAVISGGAFSQFKKQFLSKLKCSEEYLSRLFIFPTDATCFYRFENGDWVEVYKEIISIEEREKIIKALKESLDEVGYERPEKTYGEIIEDRESQITFSALGQDAPIDLKMKWDPDRKMRMKIAEAFDRRMPEYDANVGGSTSVDINRRGIDKAYGIRQIMKHLGVKAEDILFVGDALYVDGNDYSVKETGVITMAVSGPEETKTLISDILDSCNG